MAQEDVASYFNAEDAVANALPAWFVHHMMDTGGGGFALMLTSGLTMAVERIDRIHKAADGTLWLDIILDPAPSYASDRIAGTFYAKASNQWASINASHVVAAYELKERPESSTWDGGGMHVSGTVRGSR